MAATKTSWEDLARLGWPINDVYNKANAKRGGTMHGLGDIFLNSGIAADYQWWSYNTTIGSPYVISRIPKQISREETAWSYDNRQNSKPFEDSWTESWSNSRSATLSITAGVSISLHSSITIFDVASSGYDISISVEASSSETKEQRYDLTHSWTLEVGAHEKLSLIRVITTSSEVAEYGQSFGLTSDSKVGTKGDKWQDHWYWYYNLNSLLGTPRGRLTLQGNSTAVTYSFKLVREGPNGTRMEPLPVSVQHAIKEGSVRPEAAVVEKWAAETKLAVGDAPVEDEGHAPE
ncbi:cytolysin [Fomes fomentarius]|nr:cytolysin [Fomes fomentarius]